jgi:pescadillo protein
LQELHGGHGIDAEDSDERAVFTLPDDDTRPQLFSGLKFFLNREVPLEWLQLCVMSFGGEVGWEGPGSPFDSKHAGITHHIIDRPIDTSSNTAKCDREYMQPQWVFDSINASMRLPTIRYAPGTTLPPHLSPFVDDDREGYTPKYSDDIKVLTGGAAAAPTTEEPEDNKMQESDEEEDDEEDDDIEEEEVKKRVDAKSSNKSKKVAKVVEKLDESDSDEEDDEEEEEEEEDLSKLSTKKGGKGVVHKSKAGKKLTEEEEAVELSKTMMTKKTARLYGRMKYGIEKKQAVVDTLAEKRKRIESRGDADADVDASTSTSRGKGKKAAAETTTTKEAAATPVVAKRKAEGKAKKTAASPATATKKTVTKTKQVAPKPEPEPERASKRLRTTRSSTR